MNTRTNRSVPAQTEFTRFYSRQLITADDLTQDQVYARAKRRLHNRMLHGWGIVCGLAVTANPRQGAPLNVTVGAGYALSPQGDEIFLLDDVEVDLASAVQSAVAPCSNPCSGPVLTHVVDETTTLYLGIRYDECLARPVRVAPLACGCDETACEYSRVRDGVEITCLDALPATYTSPPPAVDLCDALTNTRLVPCTPCPASPWVIVATLTVSGTTLQGVSVDDRRLIVPTGLLQAHAELQCRSQA